MAFLRSAKYFPAFLLPVLTLPAGAADLRINAPPTFALLPWDGLYAGVQAGYFRGTSSGTLTDINGNHPHPWSIDLDSGLLGLHVGYDRNLGPVLLGIEADIERARKQNTITLPTGSFRFGPNFFDSELSWLGSIRGRLGLPFGNALIYGTGGFAAADVITRYYPNNWPYSYASLTDIRLGWTAGGGIEYAFAPNWSARAEYRYSAFDDANFLSVRSNAGDRNAFDLHALRFGLSWRPGDKAAPVPSALRPSVLTAPPAKGWNGFYVGANLGGVWDRTSATLFGVREPRFGDFITPPVAELNAGGVIGGVHGGLNYQIGPWVVGFEQDFALTSLKASSGNLASSITGVPAAIGMNWDMDWLATTRGRLGFAPTIQWLIYGTGGLAAGKISASTSTEFPILTYAGERSETLVGWIAGVGAEYALNDRWSVRAEYLHYDLGDMVAEAYPSISNPPFNTQTRFSWRGDIVRAGVNYSVRRLLRSPPLPRSSARRRP